MKKLLNIFLLLLLTKVAFAQAPQGIPYQAIARNSSGTIIASEPISVRFTIHDVTATGTIVYQETFSPTTNSAGLFNVNAGMGTVVSGTFSGINWGTNAKFMQVEMDPAGGTSYVDMGTTQMMSVPYALYAGSTNNGLPAGSIIAYGGNTVPSGWLLCDGSTVSRTTYSSLYSAIGNNWGAGDNSTTFNLPDSRGMFLRGVSGTSGNDPDNSTRTSIYSGGNTGNNVGSMEADAFASHSHSTANVPNLDGCCSYHIGSGGSYYSVVNNTGATGGNETRPKNVNVYYIVKY